MKGKASKGEKGEVQSVLFRESKGKLGRKEPFEQQRGGSRWLSGKGYVGKQGSDSSTFVLGISICIIATESSLLTLLYT